MPLITVEEASAQLAQIIERAESGQEEIFTSRNRRILT